MVMIKVGTHIVLLNGIQEKEKKEMLSSVFKRTNEVEEISAQYMWRLVQKNQFI